MKNIMMALAIAAIAHTGAQAQAKNATNANCGINDNVVCKVVADGKNISCYKTTYAQNFPVCKGKTGYYICCNPAKKENTNNRYKVTKPDAAAIPIKEDIAEKKMVCTKAPGSNMIVCTNVALADVPQKEQEAKADYHNYNISDDSRFSAYPY